jgi:AMP-binding enzyme
MPVHSQFSRSSLAGTGLVHAPEAGLDVSYSELWGVSVAVRDRLLALPHSSVGVTPSASPWYLAALMGGLLAGANVVIAPGPAAGDAHPEPLRADLDIRTLITEPGAAPPGPGLNTVEIGPAVNGAGDDGPAAVDDSTAALVLTGGATPVVLPAARLVRGLLALIDATGLTAADVVCVPASRDAFGMVNGMLAAWLSGASLVLPGDCAAADALAWPRACGQYKASYTAVAEEVLARSAPALHVTAENIDLSTLRVVLVQGTAGGIDPQTLRAFNDAAMEFGFDEVALCPAHSAGGALVTAMARPDSLWRCRVVSEPELGRDRWEELLTDGLELVSCGPPLPGVQVRVGAEGQASGPGVPVGPLRVRLPGDGEQWQATGQRGCLAHGELHLVPDTVTARTRQGTPA